MGCEQIFDRMTFILNRDEFGRVKVYKDVDDVAVLQLDLHLMTKDAVRMLLDKTILMMRFPFRLDLIHGFNNGVVLKNLIKYEYINDRITAIYTPDYNPGRTILEVA